MKRLIIIALLFIAGVTSAQFAVIQDKDGYVNIRSSASLSNNVKDTLNNGRLIFLYDREGSFYNAEYAKRGTNKDGYVYFDRTRKVQNFEKIRSAGGPANTEVFSGNNIKVTISRQSFVKSKYRFSYYRDAPDQIEKINGKPYYGGDGNMPATEYKSITVQVGTTVVTLPAAATENLFEPSSGTTSVYYDRAKDAIYIQASNGDGAGYYQVVWRIEKGVYVERLVIVGE